MMIDYFKSPIKDGTYTITHIPIPTEPTDQTLEFDCCGVLRCWDRHIWSINMAGHDVLNLRGTNFNVYSVEVLPILSNTSILDKEQIVITIRRRWR